MSRFLPTFSYTRLVAAALLICSAGCIGETLKTTPGEGINDLPADQVATVQWVDSVLNLGTPQEGEQAEATFRFRNTGAPPLIVHEVIASCGCTVAEWPKTAVSPGELGLIRATFDSHSRPGYNHQSLTVRMNTGLPEHTLHIEVDVRPN